MKKITITILLLLVTTFAFAQDSYQDIVYLKNGSIIKGIIIEQIPNQSIKIETTSGNIFVYTMDEIEKLAKEKKRTKNDERENSSENTGLATGYKGIVETGYQIGLGDYGMDRLKLNIINGFQLNPYFSMGFGTGLRYYFDAEAVLIPVFADFRATFIDGRISPYVSVDIGYSFDATNDFESVGLLLSPTAGASFKVSQGLSLLVGMGYEMQRMEFYNIYYGGGYGYEVFTKNSGAINLNFGLSF